MSYKDQFWGAKPEGDLLKGENVLGRLWMELRAEVADHDPDTPYLVKSAEYPNCVLCGNVISDLTFNPVESKHSGPNLNREYIDEALFANCRAKIPGIRVSNGNQYGIQDH